MPVTSTKKILASGALLKAFFLGALSVGAATAAIVHARGYKPRPMFVPLPPAPAATEIPVPEFYLESEPANAGHATNATGGTAAGSSEHR